MVLVSALPELTSLADISSEPFEVIFIREDDDVLSWNKIITALHCVAKKVFAQSLTILEGFPHLRGCALLHQTEKSGMALAGNPVLVWLVGLTFHSVCELRRNFEHVIEHFPRTGMSVDPSRNGNLGRIVEYD